MVSLSSFSASASYPVPDRKGGTRRVFGTVADTEDVTTARRFQYIKESGGRVNAEGDVGKEVNCVGSMKGRKAKPQSNRRRQRQAEEGRVEIYFFTKVPLLHIGLN